MDAAATTSPAPAPVRGEPFADPAVAVVWAAVEQLDDAGKHDVLREELAVAGTGGGHSAGRRGRCGRCA
ncbi:MAG TPA: hypothetical protein VFM58_16610 [Solirubrobacteraceae bacterium]|nr:hypothetical protein [Solirubrobacteraceae bacterium]